MRKLGAAESVRDLRQIIDLSDHQLRQFETYLATLRHWNTRIALTSKREADLIVTRHFADCLRAVESCRQARFIIDLGTGAGLPGIPLAIALPATKVTLVDSAQKKVSFLTEVIRATRLHNARAIASRYADLLPAHEGQYDLVISRALSSVNEFLPTARRFLGAGGRIVMMKGPNYAHEVEAATVEKCGLRLAPPISYRLMDDTPRVLLVFDS